MVEQPRSTQRYEPHEAEVEGPLVIRMLELVPLHPRYREAVAYPEARRWRNCCDAREEFIPVARHSTEAMIFQWAEVHYRPTGNLLTYTQKSLAFHVHARTIRVVCSS